MAKDKEQTYGVAAALSEAMEAVVFADSSAAYKAYNMIEKYAYGEDIYVNEEDEDEENPSMDDSKNGEMTTTGNKRAVGSTELAMAEFTMQDADGKTRTVSIPKITMMPLPLLHVTEATFDIEMTANIENAAGTEESSSMNNTTTTPTTIQQTTTQQATTGTRPTSSSAGRRPASATGTRTEAANPATTATNQVTRPTSSSISRPSTSTGSRVRKGVTVFRRADGTVVRTFRPSVTEREEELIQKASAGMRPSTATVTKQQMVIGKKSSSSESSSSTVKMNVKVNLKQAELPEGIKLLLQAAANSLQVAATQINGEQQTDNH